MGLDILFKKYVKLIIGSFKWSWPIRDYKLIRIIDRMVSKLQRSKRFSILDLGCGYGVTSVRIVRKSALRHSNVYMIGLDIDARKLRIAKRYLDDTVLGDAAALPFRSNAFDLIFMIEVLDHLPKHVGLRLLSKELDSLYRLGIIITCPNGSAFNRTIEPYVWDRHNSDWYPQELSRLGYNVIAIIPKTLVSILAKFSKRPFLLLQLLMPLLGLIALPPHVGWQLIAWKTKGALAKSDAS
jgi:SAM-dependent methyltransferase